MPKLSYRQLTRNNIDTLYCPSLSHLNLMPVDLGDYPSASPPRLPSKFNTCVFVLPHRVFAERNDGNPLFKDQIRQRPL